MVFGLALSLGALVLINQPVTDAEHLYVGLLVFGFSFVILVTVWYSYSTIMAVLPVETRGLTVANLVLLFVVALEPYLLYVFAYAPGQVSEPASILYATDLGVMNAVLGGFLHILSREERPLVPVPALRKMRIRRDFTFTITAVFLLSALPVFWTPIWPPGVPARVVLWMLTLPAGWIIRVAYR